MHKYAKLPTNNPILHVTVIFCILHECFENFLLMLLYKISIIFVRIHANSQTESDLMQF